LPARLATGKEIVIGLGAGVQDAARLYAHLTARQYRLADSLAAVADGPQASVIVTTSSWVNDELLEIASLPISRRPVTGIVYADNEDELLDQVLIRSAAASLHARVGMPRIDIYPNKPLPHLAAPGREVLGGKSTASEIIQALKRGAGVLCVNTHADGVDAFMGPHLTLCAMDRTPAGADEHRSPRCRETGACHRMHVPIQTALASGALIYPEIICARVLIWSVCTGVLLSEALVDPAWGIARRLLRSSTLGAIITTWGVVITDDSVLNRMANELTEAVPVGRALSRFNHSSNARRLGYRMCLFGDPRVRVTSKEQGAALKGNNQPLPARPSAPVNKALLEIPLLRACLTLGRRSENEAGPASESAVTDEVLASINSYERMAWLGAPVEEKPDSPGPVMRRSITNYLLRKRGRFNDDWTHLVANLRADAKPSACFGCGRRTNTLLASLRIPGVARRRLIICPVCGVIADCPEHARMTLELEANNAVRLGGELPSEHWTAGLYLASSSAAYSSWFDWPAAIDARPLEVFAPPERWPPGPLRIGVVMMWDSFVAIVSVPGRWRKVALANSQITPG
jgi:hypothetical protein